MFWMHYFVVDVECALGSLQNVDVDSISDVSEVHSASFFRVEMSIHQKQCFLTSSVVRTTRKDGEIQADDAWTGDRLDHNLPWVSCTSWALKWSFLGIFLCSVVLLTLTGPQSPTIPPVGLKEQTGYIHEYGFILFTSTLRMEVTYAAETSATLPTSTRYKGSRPDSTSTENHHRNLKAYCFLRFI